MLSITGQIPVTAKLNDSTCEAAGPKAKPYKIFDHGGLHLLIAPTGGKLWRWKYRYEGKQKQMAFGRYPDVSLAQARLLHAEAQAKLATGTDPMAERKEKKTFACASLAAQKCITKNALDEFVRHLLALGIDRNIIQKEMRNR